MSAVISKRIKKPSPFTDAQVADRLYALGFYDSWISQCLIDSERKKMEQELRQSKRKQAK